VVRDRAAWSRRLADARGTPTTDLESRRCLADDGSLRVARLVGLLDALLSIGVEVAEPLVAAVPYGQLSAIESRADLTRRRASVDSRGSDPYAADGQHA
jgi:hypothetical protein